MLLTEYDEVATMELFKAEGREEGIAIGEARGEARGEAKGRAEILSALVKDGFLPAAEAAKRLDMTESEFLKLSGQYIAH